MEMSKEYGTALFSLACECNTVEEYDKALDIVISAFKETPEYMEFLAAPSIPKTERTFAVEQAFGGSVPEYIVSFLKVLCEKGRIRSLEGCVLEYKKLLDASQQISKAKVVSAVELTASEIERLKHKLENMSGRSVVLECSVDKSLMGGMVVEIDGKVIDGTLRHRLREVKDVMSR